MINYGGWKLFQLSFNFEAMLFICLSYRFKIFCYVRQIEQPQILRDEHGIGNKLLKENQANLNSLAKSRESLFFVGFIDKL